MKYSYDETTDTFTVEGIRYSGELLRTFGVAPVGSLLRIERRGDGTVTVHQYARGETVIA